MQIRSDSDCFFPFCISKVREKIKKSDIWETDNVKRVILAGENKLKDNGRILVRNSGTEPLIRIMAEGDDHAVLNQVVDDIVSEIEQSLNL